MTRKPKTLYKLCLRKVVNTAKISRNKKQWEKMCNEMPKAVKEDLILVCGYYPESHIYIAIKRLLFLCLYLLIICIAVGFYVLFVFIFITAVNKKG